MQTDEAQLIVQRAKAPAKSASTAVACHSYSVASQQQQQQQQVVKRKQSERHLGGASLSSPMPPTCVGAASSSPPTKLSGTLAATSSRLQSGERHNLNIQLSHGERHPEAKNARPKVVAAPLQASPSPSSLRITLPVSHHFTEARTKGSVAHRLPQRQQNTNDLSLLLGIVLFLLQLQLQHARCSLYLIRSCLVKRRQRR